MTASFLARHVDDIADRLREASGAAAAAQALVANGDSRQARELLIEHMLGLQEAITLIKLCALERL